MTTTLRTLAVFIAMALFTACHHHTSIADARVLAQESHADLGGEISVEQLDENVWRHISYNEVPDHGRVASNGLFIVDEDGIILIDTPWTTDQSRRLMEWTHRVLGKDIREVIITHAHNDRFGGAAPLASAGAVFHALPLTISKIREEGTQLEIQPLDTDGTVELLDVTLHVFFPGAAHAPDNIVVWFADQDILLRVAWCAPKPITRSATWQTPTFRTGLARSKPCSSATPMPLLSFPDTASQLAPNSSRTRAAS
ncbi:MAG: metallo-beta-lactamase [Sandaracinaceae bacterium]|nr:metallo-beta-lactamase [Sandaracinaceae bacterium]